MVARGWGEVNGGRSLRIGDGGARADGVALSRERASRSHLPDTSCQAARPPAAAFWRPERPPRNTPSAGRCVLFRAKEHKHPTAQAPSPHVTGRAPTARRFVAAGQGHRATHRHTRGRVWAERRFSTAQPRPCPAQPSPWARAVSCRNGPSGAAHKAQRVSFAQFTPAGTVAQAPFTGIGSFGVPPLGGFGQEKTA